MILCIYVFIIDGCLLDSSSFSPPQSHPPPPPRSPQDEINELRLAPFIWMKWRILEQQTVRPPTPKTNQQKNSGTFSKMGSDLKTPGN